MKIDGRKHDHKTLETIRFMAICRIREGEGWEVFAKHKTASPKAIPAFFATNYSEKPNRLQRLFLIKFGIDFNDGRRAVTKYSDSEYSMIMQIFRSFEK